MPHPKTWYHGTTKEIFNKIKKDGVLYGFHKSGKRFTTLSLDKEEANFYGDVLLAVTYNPVEDLINNDYGPHSLDLKVFSPIPMSNVKRIR